ncbi:BlaI/MecI/CopY family transcriptional regulator [Pseudomarimonas arenosa]|uniref:BlaI/MecI/CopY family transcriptional regulator n=1 Tax=Pseudomarimonas arenosa TaxID=2774145 RepID=A0AAW3ZEY9_9GAMM|nr:BlaI/MecI/CopY family transcriptional regulator [Pseudomarimonas arenosa]MBD8524224.1 BlaI/MecI/CopY family transcriptional regulator [Pseudomarimonas arenosa]
MSPRPPSAKPTEAELAILKVLWELGEATVREVHQALYGDDSGYTTALKMLQVMHGKGLVRRDENQRAHVYSASVSKSATQKRVMTDLVQRLFDGSNAQLVMRALGGEQPPSSEELAQIRQLLDRLEGSDHA